MGGAGRAWMRLSQVRATIHSAESAAPRVVIFTSFRPVSSQGNYNEDFAACWNFVSASRVARDERDDLHAGIGRRRADRSALYGRRAEIRRVRWGWRARYRIRVERAWRLQHRFRLLWGLRSQRLLRLNRGGRRRSSVRDVYDADLR